MAKKKKEKDKKVTTLCENCSEEVDVKETTQCPKCDVGPFCNQCVCENCPAEEEEED